MAVAQPSHQLYPSPLRYPGGKGKLANFIKLLMVENGLVGAEYVEPYAGGAAVALSLLFEEYADHIHINDVNRSVVAFWRAVLDDTEALCERIANAVLSVDEWDRQRAIQQDSDPRDLDLAFSTFYMNRTNRSGIIRGGIIGGRDQSGPWKIDARWRPEDLTERIKKIARFRSRITVTQFDTADYLERVLPTLSRAFVYLDPPYYKKGRRLYEDFYMAADHDSLASLVLSLKLPWVVSYDAVPEVQLLYGRARKLDYGLNYTARHRFVGSEVMFFSPGLEIPDGINPTRVTFEDISDSRAAAALNS